MPVTPFCVTMIFGRYIVRGNKIRR